MITESRLREFYQYVYPVDLIVRWLSYNPGSAATALEDELRNVPKSGDGNDEEKAEKMLVQRAIAAESYLARREFCFTLIGDIFTRFRSYSGAKELRNELVNRFPEKIDVGGVYNVRPNQKQNAANVVPLERELIFDIDMTDYDNVRSCCSGKSICQFCWMWMACAASILRSVMEIDFGFKYILPVFSGRRGIHIWVCDRRARKMLDDERAALVGYLTVVTPKTMKASLVADLVGGRPIHPTIAHLLREYIDPAFTRLFVLSDPAVNPNSIGHPRGAKVVFDAIASALKMGARRDVTQRFFNSIPFEEGNILDWRMVTKALGDNAANIISGAQLLVMYPRLDEHVTTRRDHLLKLPFCVHPGTGSLCCPLEWDAIPTFDPSRDPPQLETMLLTRDMEAKWRAPLEAMLVAMAADPDEGT